MFSLVQPDQSRIERCLAVARRRPFSYPQVGDSRHAVAPAGAFVNHRREPLGRGGEVFAAAREALSQWRMFPADWIRVVPLDIAIQQGLTVATVARWFGLWTVNACRIVYVFEESGDAESFGFAYGTLVGHQMAGEERFMVAWDHRDDSVWYDVWSFSWPRGLVARTVCPWIRRLQRRFAGESAAAMRSVTRQIGSGEW